MINEDIIKPESEIEEIFYEKCRKKETYKNIYIEWINSKPIYENYTKMIVNSYGNYSKHDKSHSLAILDGIYAILGKERAEEMTVMDLWLILHCAYAHDIGMPYTYDEAKGFWQTVDNTESLFRKFLEECIESSEDKDAKEAAEYIVGMTKKLQEDTGKVLWKDYDIVFEGVLEQNWPLKIARYSEYLITEYCRKNHTKRSEKRMVEKAEGVSYHTPYVLSSRFYRVVATCSMVHGEDFEKILELDRNEWAKESECHPAFVAALLRLGDLLDIDNNRFDSIALQFYGRLPRISELHKLKHDAITHIALADNKIEVRANSDNLDVCKCVNGWFDYIESEVRNLIFHWEKIAPYKLKGCRLTLPNLKIFYKGQEFSSYESHEFSVNKDMLIKLVVGRNLYASELDFVREYLQNALDALKMKFWLDLNEGMLDIEIKEGVLRELKGNYAKLTPLDFKPSVFERYGIEIICEFVKKDGGAGIGFKICDRGIGIEEECVKAISSIGSGWRKRPYYKKYIGKMPAWLQPTGGFGIGIQSGFMVSDVVTIRTKCDNESMGRQITMHSSVKSGKIEEQQCEMRHTGTEVVVEIPYEKFMDNYEYKGSSLIRDNEYGDFFDPIQIMKASFNILYNYTTIVADSAIFPITIKRKGFEPMMIRKQLDENTSLIEEIETAEGHYKIYEGENIIYIWRAEDAVLCRFGKENEISNEEKQEKKIFWYYKGMCVEEKDKPKTLYFLKGFSSIKIDIMGGKVDDFLTVDRSQFMEKVDCEKIVRGFVQAYFKCSMCVRKWLARIDRDVIANKEMEYWYIWAFFYVEDTEVRKEIEFTLHQSIKNREYEGNVYRILYKKRNEQDMDGLEEKFSLDEQDKKKQKSIFDSSAKALLEICSHLWQKKSIYIINAENNELEDVKKYLMNQQDEMIYGKQIILSKDLYEIFSHFYIKDIKLYADWGNIKKESSRYKIVAYKKETSESMENAEKKNLAGQVVPSFINVLGSHKIYWASDAFKELQVTSLPWNYKVNEPMGVFGNQKIHMIICPIRPIHQERDILGKIIEGKEEPIEEIKKMVSEDESFMYLVNWVFEHQVVSHTYTKDVIRTKYMEFLEWWYVNESNKVD